MRRCNDCSAEEGAVHELACDFEECPFCLGQLASCYCGYERLGLLDPALATTGFIPREIYEGGLDDEQRRRWLAILEHAGRRPFASPSAKEPWRGAGVGPGRAVLALIDECAKRGAFAPVEPSNDIFDAPLVSLGRHGYLFVRVHPGFRGRNWRTGAIQREPARYTLAFRDGKDPPRPIVIAPAPSLSETANASLRGLDRGDDRVEWPEVGLFERGFKWNGLVKRAKLKLSFFWDLRDEVGGLTVPASLARHRGD